MKSSAYGMELKFDLTLAQSEPFLSFLYLFINPYSARFFLLVDLPEFFSDLGSDGQKKNKEKKKKKKI